MGGCLSYDKTYTVLRSSVIGSLLKGDREFDEFFRYCKTEVHAISSLIHIQSKQAFFVVVSGEVLVTLKTEDDRSFLLNTFLPGDTINFFRAGTILAGSLVSHDLKLTLSFRSTDGMAIVIGADYDAIEYYLEKHPLLTDFKTFFELNWAEFRELPAFQSLSIQQLNLLGPLIKLRATKPTELLTVANRTNTSSRDDETASTKSGEKLFNPQVNLVLTGKCLVIPQWLNLYDILKELGPGYSLVEAAKADSVKRTLWNKISDAVGLPANDRYSDEEALINEVINSLSRRGTTEIFPGSIFGFENYFTKHGIMALDSIISLKNTIIGSIETETFKQLFRLDRRFKRIMQRNFFRSLLDTVKPCVPMLSDMEDKKYSIFSCLVSLRCYQKDEEIFRKGNESFYSYLVLRGSVLEENEDNTRKLEFGSLFGEISLITNTPYFTTTYATEPTALICIDRYAFDRVYYNDKEKLAELRIRLSGKDVELRYILQHKKCNAALRDYLKKQMAEENIQFLNSVAKFDEILLQIQQEIWKVLGKDAYKFFQLVAKDNYAFFDELFGSLSKSKEIMNGSSTVPLPTDGKSLKNQHGEGKEDIVDDGRGLLEHKQSEGDGNGSRLPSRGGGSALNLRRSIAGSRASSFQQINQEMDKIADVIKEGMNNGSGTTSNIHSAHSSFIEGNGTMRSPLPLGNEKKRNSLIPDYETTPAPVSPVHDSIADDLSASESWMPYSVTEFSTPRGGCVNNDAVCNPIPKRNSLVSSSPLAEELEETSEREKQSKKQKSSRGTTQQDSNPTSLEDSNHDCYPLSTPMQSQNPSTFGLSSPPAGGTGGTSGKNNNNHHKNGNNNNNNSQKKQAPEKDIISLFHTYNQKFAQNVIELREVARTIMERHVLQNCKLEINIPQKMRLEAIEKFNFMVKTSVGRCLHELYDSIYQKHARRDSFDGSRPIRRIGSNGPEDSQVLFPPLNKSNDIFSPINHAEGINGNKPSTTSVRGLIGPPTILLHGGADSFRQNSGMIHASSTLMLPDQGQQLSWNSDAIMEEGIINEPLESRFITLFQPLQLEIYQLLNKDAFQRWKHTTEFTNLIAAMAPYDPQEYQKFAISPMSDARKVMNEQGGGTGTDLFEAFPSTPTAGTLTVGEDTATNALNRPANIFRNSSRLSMYVTSRSTTTSNRTHQSQEKEQMKPISRKAGTWKNNIVGIEG